ncbi:MAG: arylesterase [Pseudomonadota bacterium]
MTRFESAFSASQLKFNSPANNSMKRFAVLLSLVIGLLWFPGAASAETKTILLFGDSLTAGYGLDTSEGFAAQLEKALIAEGHDVKTVNAGWSGDTSTGGRSRLDWVLSSQPKAPDLFVLELGANDALRGVDPAITRTNIDYIVGQVRARGIPILLTGMMAPRNYGAEYTEQFDKIFPELAELHNVPLFPFFLKDVAAVEALNQPDGIHPNKEGVSIIVENIKPYVIKVLEGKASAIVGQR